MRLLLTNDDGIDTPGLDALRKAAAQLGEITVVAPVQSHSGGGHRVTTSEPIRFYPRGPGEYAVEGTPADCVRIALHELASDLDWVLSGINAGGNLGADVWHSGTVAAAREAVLHGKRGVAVSHYRKKGQEYAWEQASSWIVPVLRDLLARPGQAGRLWNINVPHLEAGAPPPHVVYCPLDPTPLPLSFRREGELFHYDGDYHDRERRPGCDVDVCFRGDIAVTELKLH